MITLPAMRRSPVWFFVALALVTVSCSRSAAEENTTTTAPPSTTVATTTTTTASTTTTTTAPSVPVSPLNGLPAEDPELLERGVLAVKIDNHWNARPQSGIQEADAVYELLVEAGLTRFIALFHDNDSAYLGPMRSGRPTDPTLLLPLHATFAISGAQGWVIAQIVGAGVPIVGEVRPATFRIPTRSAPHDLYVDTSLLRAYADEHGYPGEPPPDLLTWGTFTPDEEAEAVEIHFSTETSAGWQWDGERYLRSTNGKIHSWVDEAAETGRIAADTLVVLFAPFYTARPPANANGSPVPATQTVGSGRALVFARGQVAEGTWLRDATDQMIRLLRPDGRPLQVPPGVPWISLVPDGRSVVW